MITIKDLKEFASTPETKLTSYLEKKFSSMLEEYGCSMQDIGEVQVYQNDIEFLNAKEVNLSSLEVIEVIQVQDVNYLHLVQLVDDNYANDIYVPVRKEVI